MSGEREVMRKQIQELKSLVTDKDIKIAELESQSVDILGSGMDEMMKKISRLEEQIFHLTSLNQTLRKELHAGKSLLERVAELEPLLEKEQKSRLFAERLAKHMEVKCAQETEARLLTEELYNFQKEELKCAEKEITELREQLKTLKGVDYRAGMSDGQKLTAFQKGDKLAKLEKELSQLRNLKFPDYNTEDPDWTVDLHRRLEEIDHLRGDLEEINRLRGEIDHLKVQIDTENKQN